MTLLQGNCVKQEEYLFHDANCIHVKQSIEGSLTIHFSHHRHFDAVLVRCQFKSSVVQCPPSPLIQLRRKLSRSADICKRSVYHLCLNARVLPGSPDTIVGVQNSSLSTTFCSEITQREEKPDERLNGNALPTSLPDLRLDFESGILESHGHQWRGFYGITRNSNTRSHAIPIICMLRKVVKQLRILPCF